MASEGVTRSRGSSPQTPDAALLSGWGRTAPTRAEVALPQDAEGVRSLLCEVPPRGLIARGLGRCYGDAAQNAGGIVVDTTDLAGIYDFDPSTGMLTADAGVSIDAIMRAFVPKGWFPAVVPGTRFVTLGGAIAADIHGKNHHVAGSFFESLASIVIETPSGTRTLAPDAPGQGSEEFWAVAGSMGLAGVITQATLRLLPIRTSRVRVETQRFGDLDEVMQAMSEGDNSYRYSVAWIDTLAKGSSLGRSVLTRGDHAEIGDDSGEAFHDPLEFDPAEPKSVPPWFPGGLLNARTIGAFNEFWFRKAPRHLTEQIESIEAFFFPLDRIGDWNRLYGRRGFIQYQFAVPSKEHHQTVRAVLERLSDARCPSFLAVLKRFGPANAGPLSFPIEGWTLALDIPAGTPDLAALLDGFDVLVAEAGGRVYLAKDSRLRPELVPVMYPRLDEWRAVRDRFDPNHVMQSDLDRRLDLTGSSRHRRPGGIAAYQSTK